jgi:MerR family transcriptional regulator, thiopeptide resistance regulator
MFRAKEFADLAGVTVRTLHHYDRLGLLKPRRTDRGYRLYRESDLERLEQIVALKFLSLPLKEIRGLLDSPAPELPAALRMQRSALEEKRKLLDRAIGAIREAEALVASGRPASAAVLKKIIEVIEMQTNNDWMKKYASEAAQLKIDARKGEWSPELQERVSRQWTELIAEVQAAISAGEDPASPKAQALATRWKELVEGFTKGDPDVTQAVGDVWKDRANWPEHAREQAKGFQITPQMWQFIGSATKNAK